MPISEDGDPEMDEGKLLQIYFGRLVGPNARILSFYRFLFVTPQIAEGTARSLVQTFNVKKRTYFGNTSMEAEISLLMANQTLVFHLLIT